VRGARNDDGFVLFSVIWIVGLLAVVASTFAIAVRFHVRGEANLSSSVEAELAADGVVRLIGYRLAHAPLGEAVTGIPINSEPFVCRLGEDGHAIVSVQDQGGLVDLNRAPHNALAAVIDKTADQAGAGTEFAAAVADFRDADGERFGAAGDGSEESLISDGPPPKDAPFQSVDEIEQVIPADAVDLRTLKTMLTVYSRQDGIDPATAPRLLRAMIEQGSEAGGTAIPLAPTQHKTFAIDAEVTVARGSKFRRIAMISLLREAERPFAVLEWRQAAGPLSDGIAQQPGDRSCDDVTFD
jgi:general secretion pathway protein K